MRLPAAAVTPRARRALIAASSLTTLSVLLPYLVGTLADDLQATLGFGDRGLGYLVAAFWAVSALAAPTTGVAVDRFGWGRTGTAGAVLSGAALLVVGVATPSLWLLLACLLAGGFAHGLASPSSHIGLATAFPTGGRGLVFGLKQSAPPVATALAGLAVPAVALTLGWQPAFLLAAALAPLTLLLIHRTWSPGAVPRPRAATGPPPGGAASESAPGLLRLGLAGGFAATALGALTAFLMRTLLVAGVPAGVAGTAVMIASLVAIVTKVATGSLLDRRSFEPFRTTAALLATGAAGMLLLATGQPWLAVLGSAVAFAGGFGWDGVFLVGLLQAYARTPGRAAGRLQLALAGGTGLGPILFGLLVSTGGYTLTWTVFAAIAGVAAVLLRSASRGRVEIAEPARGLALDPRGPTG